VAVIAAEAAGSAGIGDQNLLQAPASPGNRLRATAQASVNPTRLQPELRQAVRRAVKLQPVRVDAAYPARVSATSASRSQPVLPQPVANGGLTQPDPLCDLAGGKALLHQPCERLAVDTSLRGVTISMNGRESVLLDPVADGRGVTARQPADGFERKPPPQIRLQDCRLHHTNTSSRAGWNQALSAVPASRSSPRSGAPTRASLRPRGRGSPLATRRAHSHRRARPAAARRGEAADRHSGALPAPDAPQPHRARPLLG
jgi:hypothetical protein